MHLVIILLTTGKTYEDYFNALGYAIGVTNFRMDAETATCDFEPAFMKAIKEQFSCSGDDSFLMICCLFHLKQAARRKLISLGVTDKSLVSEFFSSHGVFELLTVVPVDEIVGKTIPFIKSTFDTKEHSAEFEQFWVYFQSTWMERYNPEDWNINRFIVGKCNIYCTFLSLLPA